MYYNDQTCQRAGCHRPVKGNFTECSLACRVLKYELEASQNLADTLGPTEATDAYLIGIRKLVKLFDECQQARRRIHEAAMSVGIDGAGWGAIVRGET